MDQQLKQRLVGISVIFALAVIFLPMILDGSGQHLETLDVKIPVPPRVDSRVDVRQQVIELKREVDALPAMSPAVVDEVSDAAVSNESPQPAEKKAEEVMTDNSSDAKSAEKVTVEKQPEDSNQDSPEPDPVDKALVGGEQWVIQVGSFQDKDKAYKLRDRLRKSRLAAVFIEKFTQDGKLTYRVRMGPFLTRDAARVVKNKVLAKYNIKGWLMKYEK